VAVGTRLEDVAGGARLQRLEEELLVVVHRQDEHAELRAPLAQLCRRLQSGLALHADVEDREVDVVLEAALDRLGAVDRLGDELDCRIERRQLALEAPPHGDAGPLREAARETRERAREAEVVERLRPELLRNPADLLEARSYRLLRVRERLLLLGRRES